MNFESIVIRRANPDDIRQIWRILHAEVITWDNERILNNLHDLLVLVRQDQVLGVLYGHLDQKEICWVAIHPYYPEKSLQEMLADALAEFPKIRSKENERRMKNEFIRLETENHAERSCGLRHCINRPI